MDIEILGSDEESRHWFEAEVIVRSESYRSLPLLPRWLNPSRFLARRQASTELDWTPEPDIGNSVQIFVAEQRCSDEIGEFEQVHTYFIFAAAEGRDQAREQVTSYLEAGPFHQFFLAAPDQDEIEQLEEAPAVREVKSEHRQFNPFVGEEYSPSFPEVHLLAFNDRETVSGVVWLRMNRAQMCEQIARAEDFQQRNDAEEPFLMQTMMNDGEAERFLAILDKIDAENGDGWVCAPVSVANEPEVAVAVVLNAETVSRIRHAAGYPEIQDREMHIFGLPVPDFYVDEFIENAQTAVEMNSPGVAGMNFLERA